MISADRIPTCLVDRRQWLSGAVTLLVSGMLSSRWLNAAGSAAPEIRWPETPAAVSDQTDRRYVHGFEAYSGF